MLIAENEENWDSLYLDLVSCVQILQTLEKSEDEKNMKDMKSELQRANSLITKNNNIEEQRKSQVKNLEQKLTNMH